MPVSPVKLSPKEIMPWNAPNLFITQFILFGKLIKAINANVPPEKSEPKVVYKLDYQTVLEVFNGPQMMTSWLALAKSYYPFYSLSDHDKNLIKALEQKLNIKTTDYGSLADLIKDMFLTNYPKVNSQDERFIKYIETAMAKMTAVALSTPCLINEVHQHDKKFEEAGPSMSACMGPIETILSNMMKREEFDKTVIIAASALLLHIKAIKSQFELLSIMQQLDNIRIHKDDISKTDGGLAFEEINKELQLWKSKDQQYGLVKIFQLQVKINHYCEHLAKVLTKSPKDKKADAKLERVIKMKNVLDKEYLLPSQRIEIFENLLAQTKEELKDHRDPIWKRFLRDCLRILVLTFSGIAVYRKLTGQSVNFFKPSHGQIFVEDVNHITMATTNHGKPENVAEVFSSK